MTTTDQKKFTFEIYNINQLVLEDGRLLDISWLLVEYIRDFRVGRILKGKICGQTY